MLPTTEDNKLIANLLNGCTGLEYDFSETQKDGTVMRYFVKVKKDEVKKRR